jgi:outer membrane protein assembly factor BamB
MRAARPANMKRVTCLLLLILTAAMSACAGSSHVSTLSSTASPSARPSTTADGVQPTPRGSTTQNSTTSTSVPEGPLPGNLLIADRGNSRLLIVSPDKKILWSMSIPGAGASSGHLLGPDDAFLTPDKKHITINEEDNQLVAVIDIASKQIVWQYGHPGVRGSAQGYLSTPDDAYMLPDGTITVADIGNDRILFIDTKGQVIKQYGTTGLRDHNPPKALAAPNGDTPLPDGGMMITEIGGSYADRLDKSGNLVYSLHLMNVSYPSDAQLLANGNILVSDYNAPGRLEILTPQGKVVWDYHVTSGPGKLDYPSLALQLPNGNIVANDDRNHRVVVIDPRTNLIVWQYGATGLAGVRPGELNTPDGIDFIPAGSSPRY